MVQALVLVLVLVLPAVFVTVEFFLVEQSLLVVAILAFVQRTFWLCVDQLFHMEHRDQALVACHTSA